MIDREEFEKKLKEQIMDNGIESHFRLKIIPILRELIKDMEKQDIDIRGMEWGMMINMLVDSTSLRKETKIAVLWDALTNLGRQEKR